VFEEVTWDSGALRYLEETFPLLVVAGEDTLMNQDFRWSKRLRVEEVEIPVCSGRHFPIANAVALAGWGVSEEAGESEEIWGLEHPELNGIEDKERLRVSKEGLEFLRAIQGPVIPPPEAYCLKVVHFWKFLFLYS
jgi:hypothetical protein